jgi:hypothetical protein
MYTVLYQIVRVLYCTGTGTVTNRTFITIILYTILYSIENFGKSLVIQDAANADGRSPLVKVRATQKEKSENPIHGCAHVVHL